MQLDFTTPGSCIIVITKVKEGQTGLSQQSTGARAKETVPEEAGLEMKWGKK
jgi:hypothetical protein